MLKLPGAKQAIIDSRKLREYILSSTHPVGRFKAAYFSSLGYESNNWQALEATLRQAVLEDDAEALEPTPFGQKYRIRSIFTGPNGQGAAVVSIWIIRVDEAAPRFVTVMPERQQR